MTAPRPRITLTVEIGLADRETGHVEGVVTRPGRAPASFSGWLALLEVLEQSATESVAQP